MNKLVAIALATAIASGCGVASDEDAPIENTESEQSGLTVAGAAQSSCSTASVRGLSLQIIAEGQCIAPDAYVPVGSPPNLSTNSNVNLLMSRPARDALVAALANNPSRTLHVTSMLRTAAQQYLLRRWDSFGQCGIGVAADPGQSNHETGLAIDVSNFGSWTGIFPSYGFSWLGSFDPVHFDYTGTGAQANGGLGVRAFQRLYNRNHPSDRIAEDGQWGPQTEARMRNAPAEGFAIGAICTTPEPSPSTDPPGGPECARHFTDVCDSPFYDDVNWMADEGYTQGCNTAGTEYCPAVAISRGQLAGFLAVVLDLPPGPDAFTDDDTSPFENAIDAVAAAGITSGCASSPPRFCPNAQVTRGQMAAFLTNAFGFPPGPDAFTDDDGSIFEPSINALAAAGITSGCAASPPRYCPHAVVTREQIASFLHRAATN